jgi:hypothetical protein
VVGDRLHAVSKIDAVASMLRATRLGQSDVAEVRLLVIVGRVLAGVGLLGRLGLALVALKRAPKTFLP